MSPAEVIALPIGSELVSDSMTAAYGPCRIYLSRREGWSVSLKVVQPGGKVDYHHTMTINMDRFKAAS